MNESIPTTPPKRPKRQNKKAEEKSPIIKNKAEKKPRQTGYTRRQQTVATSPSAPVTHLNNTIHNTTRRPNNKIVSRSRTSTPQPEIQTPISCTTTSNSFFDHLSPSARETSPPAKIRLPSHRMSIPDMNRRANQILEYICSMQVEIATSKRKHQVIYVSLYFQSLHLVLLLLFAFFYLLLNARDRKSVV